MEIFYANHALLMTYHALLIPCIINTCIINDLPCIINDLRGKPNNGVDGFEPPAHAGQVGLAVQRLNNSATSYFRIGGD